MSSDSAILLPKDFDGSKITLSDPKGPDSKAKTVYVNYAGNKLILQTPEMPSPFGYSKWDNDGKGPAKYSIDLSFKESDHRANVAKFFDVLQYLDRLAIDTAKKNKAAWFKGKKYNDDTIENLYTPSIKYPKDKKTGEISNEYPPTFKAAFPFNEKENCITTKVYDNKRNRTNLLEMDNTKGARITLIVQCAGIWISSAGFGLSWKAFQARIVPPTTIKEYAFTPTEEDEEMEEDVEDDGYNEIGNTNTSSKTAGSSRATHEKKTPVEESDDDGNDDGNKPSTNNDRNMLDDDDDLLEDPPNN